VFHRQDEAYLDSRRGSDGIDAEHAAGLVLVVALDVAAVDRLEALFTADHRRSQEEEEED